MERSLRPCKHSGCPNLTRDASGYCEEHRAEHIQRYSDKYRKSAYKRGYDKQWQKFRIIYLSKHPLCVDCLKKGKCVPATEVHHIKKLRDYPHLKYVEDNLMGLCHDCHSVRTKRGE